MRRKLEGGQAMRQQADSDRCLALRAFSLHLKLKSRAGTAKRPAYVELQSIVERRLLAEFCPAPSGGCQRPHIAKIIAMTASMLILFKSWNEPGCAPPKG